MSRHTVPPAPCIAYGEHPDQVANLHLPAREGGPWPCVVLLHGGFWRTGWDRTLMTPLAVDLAARGIAAWNVEYRRVGQEGGGWPGTLEDVAAAVDRLADVADVDAARIVNLRPLGGRAPRALARRPAPRIPAGCPARIAAGHARRGGRPGRRLRSRARRRRDDLGGGAVEGLLGPFDPTRDAAASPVALAPLGVPQLLVHGDADDIVPASQSRAYASLDPDAELIELEGADHFEVIEPASPAWAAVLDRLDVYLGG